MNLKIEILFKLAKMYLDKNEWPKAAGCWNRIINYDTKNIQARLALLRLQLSACHGRKLDGVEGYRGKCLRTD